MYLLTLGLIGFLIDTRQLLKSKTHINYTPFKVKEFTFFKYEFVIGCLDHLKILFS